MFEAGDDPRRAEVGEQAEFGAQLEQALLGPFLCAVPFGPTDRAEQDRIRRAARRERRGGQRLAITVDRGPAEALIVEHQAKPETIG